jgi:hypothetical protein
MPIYEEVCRQCSYETEYYSRKSTLMTQRCPLDGQRLVRRVSLAAIRVFKAYTTYHIDGTPHHIDSATTERQLLAKHGLRKLEPGERNNPSETEVRLDESQVRDVLAASQAAQYRGEPPLGPQVGALRRDLNKASDGK